MTTRIMDITLLAGIVLFSLAVSSLMYWEGKLYYFNNTDDLVNSADITTTVLNAHLMLFVVAVLFPLVLGMINVFLSRKQSPTIDEADTLTGSESAVKEEVAVTA